jgi:hypothetical protein
MKNIILNIFIVILLVFGFTSCKKEAIEPTNPQTTINNPANVNPIGYTWELYSGRVFVKNLDNNITFYYDHFGPSKNSSNLDIFLPSWLPIDIITKGSTTWKFNSSNQFVLDGGSTYNYNVNTNGIFNVYGLENGSARNIEVLSSTNDYMNVKVFEGTGNDGTYNYSFYTVLTFVKVGFTGTPVLSNVPNGYSYNGVIGSSTPVTTSLVGTKWVVTKFIQNFVSTYPSDTLEFVSNTHYKINGLTLRTYNLSGIVGNNMKSLSLYSFTTLGGDWSGQVQSTFINDWTINNSDFTNIMNTNSNVKLWMVRIQ